MHRMPKPLPTRLVPGQSSPFGPGAITPGGGTVFKCRGRIHYLQHVLGVGSPVTGQVQYTARPDSATQKRDETGLHDTPLVMPFLWPWVRKEQPPARQRVVCNHDPEKLDRVRTGNTHIIEPVSFKPQQKVAHSGAVHLDAKVVFIRVCPGHLPGRLTIAKTDVKYHRVWIAEQNWKFQCRCLGFDTVARPKFFQRSLLALSQAPATKNKTSNLALPGFTGKLSFAPWGIIHDQAVFAKRVHCSKHRGVIGVKNTRKNDSRA